MSKTGDCRKLLGQPYGRNASSMTKIRSMFTLICCSLAGLKMSLRTGFCCRNVLAQDKVKMHRKLYLSLPHIGILGVPSPNCMLHLQFWDGALLPPAVLGWRLLTCSFFLADFSHAVLNGTKESWYKSLVKNAKITENKNDQCNHATNLPLKMRKSTKTKTINGIMLQIFRKKRESQQKQR